MSSGRLVVCDHSDLQPSYSVQTRIRRPAQELVPWFTEPGPLEAWLAHEACRTGDSLEFRRPGHPLESWDIGFPSPLRIVWRHQDQLLDWTLTAESPTSTVVQLHHSQPDRQAVPALASSWRIDLAALRFALTQCGNPPGLHQMSCLSLPASIPDLFPALVYPQWLSEWLAGVELGRMLESTRRDALHEWPAVRGTLAFRTSQAGLQQTRLCLEVRAWDPLRFAPATIAALFDDGLSELASWW